MNAIKPALVLGISPVQDRFFGDGHAAGDAQQAC